MSIIEKRNLIVGIFREVSILGIQVFVNRLQNNTYFLNLLGDELQNPSRELEIEIVGLEQNIDLIQVTFEIQNKAYEAKLNSIGLGRFAIPLELRVSDKRREVRLSSTEYSTRKMIVEIHGSGWRKVGCVRDFTRSMMAVVVNAPFSDFQIKQAVDIEVYSNNREIVNNSMFIQSMRLITPTESLVLLSDISNINPQVREHVSRTNRDGISRNQTIECCWPDTDGLRFIATIIDIGFGGFKAKVLNDQELPPLGALFNIIGLHFKCKLVWLHDDFIGCDLRHNDRERFNEWVHTSSIWQQSALLHAPPRLTNKKIISTMLRSGYLQGQKARNISGEVIDEMLVNPTQKSSTWIKRFSSSVGSNLSDHVSFLRLSDTSWLIQELGNASDVRGVAGKLIEDAILDFYMKEEFFQGLNSVLLALYQPQIKFNESFWHQKAIRHLIKENPAYVGTLNSDILISLKSDSTMKLGRPKFDTWKREYEELASMWSRNVLSGLGLTSDSFNAPLLNRDLSETNYSLKRSVAIAYLDKKASCVAVRFGLPTFSNLTISANHLWILIPDLSMIESFLCCLYNFEETKSLLNGVTQVVVTTDKDNEIKSFQNTFSFRHFALLSIPFHELPTFIK